MIEQSAAHGWEIVPFTYRGEHRGTAALKGTEIHFEVIKPPAILRNAAREFLGALLNERGFLTTRVPPADAPGQRFVRKLAFEKTWSDGQFDYFILTAPPFSKEA